VVEQSGSSGKVYLLAVKESRPGRSSKLKKRQSFMVDVKEARSLS
jgi:hypothetical protein